MVELSDDIITKAAVIHDADKSRPELHVRDILSDIPAHTSVHLDYMTGVTASRDVLRMRISLDIHKCRPDNNDACAPAALLHLPASDPYAGFCRYLL